MTLLMKPTLQIIITDENLSQAVRTTLSGLFNIVSNANIDKYLSSSEHENCNVVICQKELLNTQQISAIESIKSVNPDVRILIIGSNCASNEQVALLKHGVRGYFDASFSLDKLNEAIQCVLHGEVWIERHIISGLIDELAHIPEVSEEQRQAVSTLSPKELEVAQLVSRGATNKMIAKNMNITERTVKAHLTTIFQKMGLADRLSLAIFFRDLR